MRRRVVTALVFAGCAGLMLVGGAITHKHVLFTAGVLVGIASAVFAYFGYRREAQWRAGIVPARPRWVLRLTRLARRFFVCPFRGHREKFSSNGRCVECGAEVRRYRGTR